MVRRARTVAFLSPAVARRRLGALLVAVAISGCQLVVDFDRSAIVDAAADVPEAGPADGATVADASPDAPADGSAAADASADAHLEDAGAPDADGPGDAADAPDGAAEAGG